MGSKSETFVTFLSELMERRGRIPSQLAADIGVSHTSVGRWLSGKDLPSPRSCQRLADYASLPLQRVLSIVGYLPSSPEAGPEAWPHFRQYAQEKYPDELDDDLITMIEDLIERRKKRHEQNR